MSWTDERVELLRKLWLDGLSASQIANELSNGITRNAVIGKVHRLGLSGRAKAPAPSVQRARTTERTMRPAAPAPRASAPLVRGNLAFALAPSVMQAPEARVEEEAVVVPLSERVTIMELRESMCRWPLGDPASSEFRYCGADAPIGAGPYCRYHARVAYQPAQDRRRDRKVAAR